MTEPAAEAAIRVACRELHLPTIAAEATQIADDAARERLTHRAFLAEVLAAEVDERANRRRTRRLHQARSPRTKRLEDSWLHRGTRRSPDHSRCAAGRRAPSTPATQSCCSATCGTGKSHLLIGLGVAAYKSGRRVRYATTAALVNELVEAAGERILSRAVARYGPMRPAMPGRTGLPAPRQPRR